jgi:hypothetical protein
MKISASASGGFAGQAQHHEIDTDDCPVGTALAGMLDDIGFFAARADATPGAVGADLCRWTITATDGRRRHSVSFVEDGSSESAPWQNLLSQIRAAA